MYKFWHKTQDINCKFADFQPALNCYSVGSILYVNDQCLFSLGREIPVFVVVVVVFVSMNSGETKGLTN